MLNGSVPQKPNNRTGENGKDVPKWNTQTSQTMAQRLLVCGRLAVLNQDLSSESIVGDPNKKQFMCVLTTECIVTMHRQTKTTTPFLGPHPFRGITGQLEGKATRLGGGETRSVVARLRVLNGHNDACSRLQPQTESRGQTTMSPYTTSIDPWEAHFPGGLASFLCLEGKPNLCKQPRRVPLTQIRDPRTGDSVILISPLPYSLTGVS